MTVKEIVKKWLEDNNYNGLYSEDCGCFSDDLMPCNNDGIDCSDCRAGYATEDGIITENGRGK